MDLLWWIGWAWFAGWIALPLAAVPAAGPVVGLALWLVLAPWSGLAGMVLAHRLLPRSEPGRFEFPGDSGSIRWALGTWAPSLYLSVFQPVFFNSRAFQRIVLRVFGARLGRGAWITSRTIAREPQHLTLGHGTLVGEFAHLATSYQPRPGLLIVAGISIGSESLVGAHAHLAPGVTIGSRCILEHAAVIGGGTRIGDDVRIGAATTIYNRVRIGHRVVIGKNCMIPTGATLEDGTTVPDATILGSGSHAPGWEEAR